MVEAEVELVTPLTSKKLLKQRPDWNMAQLYSPCEINNATFKPHPTTILKSLKLKIARLLFHLPADGWTIFNSGF